MNKKWLGLLGAVATVPVAGWVGLQVKPAPFPAYPERTPQLDTVPVPDRLPEPVVRFYRAVYGERVPLINSAVMTGPATLRQFGIRFPGRYRFVHEAGQGYRHYLEATVFGWPLMTVNEWYLDGKCRLELPVGVVENEPQIDQAANLGLWGESMAYAEIFVTDPRVHWESVDDVTARLIVPFGDEEETFTVRFDADTGLIRRMEAMRWRDPGDTSKILWWGEVESWQRVDGQLRPRVMSVTWQDQGTPWALFTIEDLVFNVDVSAYIRERGL
jgi:hypothetical protein